MKAEKEAEAKANPATKKEPEQRIEAPEKQNSSEDKSNAQKEENK